MNFKALLTFGNAHHTLQHQRPVQMSTTHQRLSHVRIAEPNTKTKAFKRQKEDFIGFDLVEGKNFAATYPDRLARCLENMASLLNKGEEECEMYLNSRFDVHLQSNTSSLCSFPSSTTTNTHFSSKGNSSTHSKLCDEIIAPFLSHFSDDSFPTKSISPSSTIDLQATKNDDKEDAVSLLSLPLADSYDEQAEWQYVDNDSTADHSDVSAQPKGKSSRTTMLIDRHESQIKDEAKSSSMSVSSAFRESFQHSMEESRGEETCDTSLLSVDAQMMYVDYHGNLATDCIVKKSQSSDLLNAILCAASLASKSRRQRRNSGKAELA